MRKIVVILLLLTGYVSVAQQAQSITFEEPSHDFGTIKEENGPAEFDFKFKNTGSEPLKILNVKASCGCTTPNWTREEVAPGGEGFIRASYNPHNRPGPFHKTLTVTTSTSANNTVVLRINGQVEPKPRTVEDDLPTLMGAIRVKYKAFNLGKVYNNEPTVGEFDVYNASESPITFNKEVEGPAYIKVEFSPETLAPKEKGKVVITYNAEARNDLGFISDNIVFKTNEEGDNASKSMAVYATIEEYFPPMTEEELQAAAHLGIEEPMHDFGNVTSGDKLETTFVLTNTGKSDLNIRKTKASCGCTVPQLAKEDLKPGESVEMKVTFNTFGRRGNQIKTVTIYSNDPSKPVQKVTVKASVAAAPAN
ncbi:MAG: DUF1573 domain-containing protein [Cyclobacteriaceae bacterium]|nr:DUF1573 domain-containing protein [Cyclobacteriaceae bacterium]